MNDRIGKIISVESWKCVVALPHPLELGHLTISERDYVVVRVTTDSGLTGVSFGLGRGAPVDVVVVEVVAGAILGREVSEIGNVADLLALQRPQHAPEGLVLRALSQVDVALWDIRGKYAGKPVWELLGARGPQTADILLVEGYHMPGEADEQFAERMARRAREGYSALKIEASTPDHSALARRLALTKSMVGDDVSLMIDLAYAFTLPADRVVDWFDLDLEWAEDPVHGNRSAELEEIRSVMPTPLAVGDEVTNPEVLRRLMEQAVIDVVRLDVTCHGGITGVVALSRMALECGVRVSTHVYPELHQHIAFGLPNAGLVEMFPDNGGLWDATSTLMLTPRPIAAENGRMLLPRPSAPGLAIKVDWDAVERHAVRLDSRYQSVTR